MRRCVRGIAATLLLLLAVAAGANDEPRVLYGAEAVVGMGTPVTVRTELMQVELAPNLVLSAGRGAEFSLERSELGTKLLIVSGPAMVVDLARNNLVELAAGSYLLRAGSGRTEVVSENATPSEPDDILSLQRSRPADALMLRQQSYLDSLGFDIIDLNRVVVRFLRGLSPRGR